MHLVDAHRRRVPAGRRPAAPASRRRPTRSRVGARPTRSPAGPRCANAIGSAFSRHCAVRPEDVELVLRARPDAGHEQLPDAGGAERAHRVGPALPVVEVAGDPHAAGVRRPHRERGAGRPGRAGCRTCGRARRATSHSCSCRPSPIRCRSISPSVGSQRYGSSTRWVSSAPPSTGTSPRAGSRRPARAPRRRTRRRGAPGAARAGCRRRPRRPGSRPAAACARPAGRSSAVDAGRHRPRASCRSWPG